MPTVNMANKDESMMSSWMDSFTLDDFELNPIPSAVAVITSPNQSRSVGGYYMRLNIEVILIIHTTTLHQFRRPMEQRISFPQKKRYASKSTLLWLQKVLLCRIHSTSASQPRISCSQMLAPRCPNSRCHLMTWHGVSNLPVRLPISECWIMMNQNKLVRRGGAYYGWCRSDARSNM